MDDKRPWLSAYNYCQLNPVMRTDPTGMIDIMIEDFSGGGEGDGNGDPPAKVDITPRCPKPTNIKSSETVDLKSLQTPKVFKPGDNFDKASAAVTAASTLIDGVEIFNKLNPNGRIDYYRYNLTKGTIQLNQFKSTLGFMGRATLVGGVSIDLFSGLLGKQSPYKTAVNIGVGVLSYSFGGPFGLTMGLGYFGLDQAGLLDGPKARIQFPSSIMAMPDATYYFPKSLF